VRDVREAASDAGAEVQAAGDAAADATGAALENAGGALRD
jgi:hypothetical protein